MLKTLKCVGVLVLMSAVLSAQEPAVPKELAPYQGSWVISAIDGQAPPFEYVLVVNGSKYHTSANGEINETGVLKIDASKNPVAVDLIIETGDDAGKTQLGVIKVDGDRMVGKLTIPGTTTRPTTLDPEEGAFLFEAQRRK